MPADSGRYPGAVFEHLAGPGGIGFEQGLGAERPLPRRWLERWRPAEGKHRRAGLERNGVPAHLRVAHENVCARTGLELVAVEGEARAAGVYEVELLVAGVSRLVVRLDDVLPGRSRGIGIAAERPNVEVSAHRAPGQRIGSGNGLQLVEAGYRVAHRATP